MRALLPFLLVATLAAPGFSARAEPAPTDQALQALEQRLSREREAAARLAEKEVGLLGQLAGLERLIELEARSVKAAQARLKQGAARLQLGEQRAEAAEGELAGRTRALGPRLTARYRMGREGSLRFLLGARSIGELLRRRRLFNALVQQDIEALASLRAAAGLARAARDELAKAKEALAVIEKGESDRRRTLQARVAQQKSLIAAVQDQRSAHEEAARELEEAAKALSQKLRDLRGDRQSADSVTPAPAVPFKKLRGKLLFPVDEGRIEVRFGRRRDPRFGTVTLQRGIDVRAPEGTEVHAVHKGRVAHSGWFKGYGNLVIIDHGEGYYSLMAHLGAVLRAVGDEVHKGDPVGTVGDSGSLKGVYLYFELREGIKALDPERWLARKRKPAPKLTKKASG